MIVLLSVAVLAGAGTALSPCVLPVLPALLAATGTGGRRRPFGVVVGLTVTFALTVVGLAEVIDGVGLSTGATRDVAIGVLIAAGLALLVPALAARVEAPLSRLARFGPRSRGDGLASGLLVGAALGFVYAPCAGPVLAAVVTVGAASGATVAIGVAYALGSAVALVTRADIRFETAIARHAPDVSLTAPLEDSAGVRERLSDLRPLTGIAAAVRAHPPAKRPPMLRASMPGGRPAPPPQIAAADLEDYGPAPEFTGTQRWFNTPDGAPLTLAGLRGRVVLVDFWTYTCINCLRTLPYLEAWDTRYRDDGLTIVGVHTPEFGFEHDADNVRAAIAANGIKYPVVQDNDRATWNAYGNQYWPAEYLIDQRGHVRHVELGEGDYDKTEAAIRALLHERGAAARPQDVVTTSGQRRRRPTSARRAPSRSSGSVRRPARRSPPTRDRTTPA